MKNIRHIFFDLDNTLWDHRKNAKITLEQLFKKYQIQEKYHFTFEDFHVKYEEINEHLWDLIRDGEIDKDYLRAHRFHDTFLHFSLDNFELAQIFENQFLDEIIAYNELVDGSLELLEYLESKNYQLHIISNGFHEVTHRKIDGSGIRKYMKTVTSADDVNVRKPNPIIFEYSLKKANAEKSESILIGDDWIADVKGAQNFGMDVIFFDALSENKTEEGLITVQKLEEIRNYL
jgi:putative hydrolase of the HAD superfamily